MAGMAEIGGKSSGRQSFGERAEGGKSGIPEAEQTGASAWSCAFAGLLAYLKYYNFFASNISGVIEMCHLPFSLEQKSLIMPIGISFYTLQAIGYMADVYW